MIATDFSLTRTRIVATLGPASDAPGVLTEMIASGMNVARINFSHGTADDHRQRVAAVRAALRPQDHIAILGDLPGPKLRALLGGPREFQADTIVTLGADASVDICITEPQALTNVKPGDRILLDDGRLQMRAVHAAADQVKLHVEIGGVLLPNKGVNLPDTELGLPALTKRDRSAIALAAELGIDWLALSFVRNAAAADEVRQCAEQYGLRVPVMAKMERPEAVANCEPIIDAFDGIMIARGDLGVEMDLTRVPFVQKRLIALARAAAKPVVTATEMLDSMRDRPRPTRAEVSDVANAVLDGADAVMLSGETAVGSYPALSVRYMDRILREAEAQFREIRTDELELSGDSITAHITQSTCRLARKIGADAIITPTHSGRTPRLVARHRPSIPIIAAVPDESISRRMSMIWGVTPVISPETLKPGDDRIHAAVRAAFANKAVEQGQLVVVKSEHPFEGGVRIPTVRVLRVGANGDSCEP